MFRNRLRKNLKRLEPWAGQRSLDAYRLYDSDIPEVRLIVERYADSLVLWEYARRADAEAVPAEREHFLSEVLSVLAEECAVARRDIFVKQRRRQRTASAGQYQPQEFAAPAGEPRRERLVREGGHRFWVNLSDYLDTGLFLDHRETRALVGRLSAGKRVLNLFGYTGSFTVYAAGGGAESSVTVDLSATYLDWAARNFAENGMDLRRHRLVRADVLTFLQKPPAGESYDLIVLDPPTFSNSKRMRGTLDVARDHPWLIDQALRLLTPRPGSALLFSSNNRRFTLRIEEIKNSAAGSSRAGGLDIRDLSSETLPRDFHDPRTRCCYLISRV